MITDFLDPEHLPEQYVIKKFYEYGYGVTYSPGDNTYNCSCPVCYEGRSFGKKKRCYYLPNKNLIYCFNCGWSSRPYKWIKEVGGLSAEDIREELITGDYNFVNIDNIDKPLNISALVCDELQADLPENSINLFDAYQMNYYKSNSIIMRAQEYLRSRRLNSAINRPRAFYMSLEDYTHRNRLIIPFYDAEGKIIHYQSRAIGCNTDSEFDEVRYLSKKGGQCSIFNIDNVDMDYPYVFLFEGPFDACFVKNGLAVAGINDSSSRSFTKIQEEQLAMLRLTHKPIWVLDNQWIDDAAYKKSAILLENGECVFVWPEQYSTNYKDFNELCADNNQDGINPDFILDNSYCGEAGLIKYKFLLKNRKT